MNLVVPKSNVGSSFGRPSGPVPIDESELRLAEVGLPRLQACHRATRTAVSSTCRAAARARPETAGAPESKVQRSVLIRAPWLQFMSQERIVHAALWGCAGQLRRYCPEQGVDPEARPMYGKIRKPRPDQLVRTAKTPDIRAAPSTMLTPGSPLHPTSSRQRRKPGNSNRCRASLALVLTYCTSPPTQSPAELSHHLLHRNSRHIRGRNHPLRLFPGIQAQHSGSARRTAGSQAPGVPRSRTAPPSPEASIRRPRLLEQHPRYAPKVCWTPM